MAAASSRRGVLRRLHRVLGLFVALYVLMASATGAALMFRHELIGIAHPQLGPPPADVVARAELLAARLKPGSFNSIMFPDRALPAFIVYRPGYRTALYDPRTLEPLPDRFWLNRAMDWLFELHHYLLAGETGKVISGIFGIAIAAVVLIGLYLWWPWRRGWRLRHAWPKRPTRSSRLAAHTTLAIIAAPGLLIASVTGAAVVFPDQARGALVAALGARDGNIRSPLRSGTLSELAVEAFPGAEPRLLVPSKSVRQPLTLRVRMAQERHPNGRSSLSYDQESRRAVATARDPESGTGNRAYNSLYPTHTGHIGGAWLRVLLMMGALAAFVSTLMGVAAWAAGRPQVKNGTVRRDAGSKAE